MYGKNKPTTTPNKPITKTIIAYILWYSANNATIAALSFRATGPYRLKFAAEAIPKSAMANIPTKLDIRPLTPKYSAPNWCEKNDLFINCKTVYITKNTPAAKAFFEASFLNKILSFRHECNYVNCAKTSLTLNDVSQLLLI